MATELIQHSRRVAEHVSPQAGDDSAVDKRAERD
jgi:hypothetical protein